MLLWNHHRLQKASWVELLMLLWWHELLLFSNFVSPRLFCGIFYQMVTQISSVSLISSSLPLSLLHSICFIVALSWANIFFFCFSARVFRSTKSNFSSLASFFLFCYFIMYAQCEKNSLLLRNVWEILCVGEVCVYVVVVDKENEWMKWKKRNKCISVDTMRNVAVLGRQWNQLDKLEFTIFPIGFHCNGTSTHWNRSSISLTSSYHKPKVLLHTHTNTGAHHPQ